MRVSLEAERFFDKSSLAGKCWRREEIWVIGKRQRFAADGSGVCGLGTTWSRLEDSAPSDSALDKLGMTIGGIWRTGGPVMITTDSFVFGAGPLTNMELCESVFGVSTTELIERIKALPKAERQRVADFVEKIKSGNGSGRRKHQDLEIINRRASRLNREAADVLDYQIGL